MLEDAAICDGFDTRASAGLSSVGRACDCRSKTPSGSLLVSRGRWFESDRPDFFLLLSFSLDLLRCLRGSVRLFRNGSIQMHI